MFRFKIAYIRSCLYRCLGVGYISLSVYLYLICNLWAYSNRKVVYQIINPSYSAILYVQRCVRYIQIRDYFTCQGLVHKGIHMSHTGCIVNIYWLILMKCKGWWAYSNESIKQLIYW